MSSVPPPPSVPPSPQGSWPPPPPAPPAPTTAHRARTQRRGRRIVAGAAAVGLLAVGSLATGAAIGLNWDRNNASSSSTAQQDPSVIAEPPTSYDGQADGQGDLGQLPDFGQGSSGSSGSSSSSSSDATAEQSSGLVLISSTLTNGTAAGTGILLSSDGTVVTNHHVVEGATELEVTIATTGETYAARYVGGSDSADVAVIQLEDASGLTPASISADDAAVGDAVTAVGDAGGDGGSLTASPGTVTALDQDITVSNEDGTSAALTDLIQLQAYVVPGDSGGAVLDSDGDVVGMNVAASSDSRRATGYAIPFDTVGDIVTQVLSGDESGDVALGYRGYLGISLSNDSDEPVVLDVTDGTAAEDAGLVSGDTITSVGGTSVSTASALSEAIASYDAGDRVTITWTTTSGEERSTTVTLGEGPIR